MRPRRLPVFCALCGTRAGASAAVHPAPRTRTPHLFTSPKLCGRSRRRGPARKEGPLCTAGPLIVEAVSYHHNKASLFTQPLTWHR